MKYRRSPFTYARKYGVSRASRKHNKSRSYIYFRRARHDGSLQSLVCRFRRPHSHPNQHPQEEHKLIADMHRRNPRLGIMELWARMRKRGYILDACNCTSKLREERRLSYRDLRPIPEPKDQFLCVFPFSRINHNLIYHGSEGTFIEGCGNVFLP